MDLPASTPPEVREAFAILQANLVRAEKIIQLQNEQIRLLNIKLFGPKADKLTSNQMDLLGSEVSLTQPEVDQEADRPDSQKQLPAKPEKVRATHPGREPLPAHLERREVIIKCEAKDCRCDKCGAERPVIGYETKETLKCIPASFYVEVTKREKRGSHCFEEQGVATAPAPAEIVPKGKLSNEFIIEALIQKYQQHLPIYRQCAWLEENHQIELDRKTVTSAVIAAGALLVPVVQAQAKELMAGNYLQADETTMPCQTRERTGKNHKAYMWEYSRPNGPVVFDFQMGRGRDGPKQFLKGFRGVLQCDGYSSYDKLGDGIMYAACMAHVRREFVEAGQVSPKDPVPPEIVERIRRLYDVETEARDRNLSPAERLNLRKEKSVPLMADLKARIMEVRQQIMPGSQLAKACDYVLGQWARLETFLNHGEVEIDNNWCEGAMRPLALGRKNWLHIGDPAAGPKVAAIASIVETCRRLNINLREYLTDVLPKLAAWATTTSQVATMTPSAWKAARSS